MLDGGDSDEKQSLNPGWSPILLGIKCSRCPSRERGTRGQESREEFLEKTLELKLKDSKQRKEHFKRHTGKGKVDDLEQNFRVTPGACSASVLSHGAACGSLGECSALPNSSSLLRSGQHRPPGLCEHEMREHTYLTQGLSLMVSGRNSNDRALENDCHSGSEPGELPTRLMRSRINIRRRKELGKWSDSKQGPEALKLRGEKPH